ncbi:hypothetical protein [Mycobacterium camsae]|uniref:hypothetical protein n=1 Tax=Mycobacterium gordonae TaxID=1778 RepID=UPI0019819AA9|nr:hypothetical protein [Mycobacterium gordonae]
MDKITGPVTRTKVEALAVDWADDPSTTVEIVHREFNADQHSGGYAFLCDRGLLIYGLDGASTWSLDPGDAASRFAKVEQYWRESQHRNRALRLDDVSPWHRAAIAALVSSARSVADVPPEARLGVTDTGRADALFIMLRRHVRERSEESALRTLASNDWLLEVPQEDRRAHQCPVCGFPALGRPWQYFSVCDDCFAKTVCSHGRIVTGYNTDFSGGFEAMHVDDHSVCEEVGRTGLVWVEGYECLMGEAKFGGVFVGVQPAREFRDDDAGYLAWLDTHPDGYVINIARSHSATAARVHHAGCWTIRGEKPGGSAWTGPYVKVCAQHIAELEQWASDQVGQPIPSCGTCQPARDAVQPPPTKSTKPTEQAVAPPLPYGHCEIHGPTASSPAVQAWADDYIRFEHLPVWQQHLRHEIRNRCQELAPPAEQVLHTTFFGPKHPRADVENLVLYYIDSFRVAGRNGIRFEHGAAVPSAPDGAKYPFCYRYALSRRSDAFAYWRHGRTLASFDWTDLGAFAGEKKLAQVWLALARGQVEVSEPACAPETPFAVRVQVRPPHGLQPVWGGLVKGIFDGVICALQAHTDTAVLPDVVARLAKDIPAQPAEIEHHLLDERRAVLGAAHRLVSPYGAGVKWDPKDHLCVAGELLAAEPVDRRWAIKGDLVELSR